MDNNRFASMSTIDIRTMADLYALETHPESHFLGLQSVGLR